MLRTGSGSRCLWQVASRLTRSYSSLQSSIFRCHHPTACHRPVRTPAAQIDLSQPSRSFYRMLNAVFNRPDRNRIKEVGAERACAEWLLRCGAQVRWKDGERWQKDYNTLTAVPTSSPLKIEAIDADEAAVMEIGFPHLEGLSAVRSFRFHHCPYLEDGAIEMLGLIKDTLEHVEITSCGDITDQGLTSLSQLKNLKTLLLKDLPEVRNKQACVKSLKNALPGCKIDYVDAELDSQK